MIKSQLLIIPILIAQGPPGPQGSHGEAGDPGFLVRAVNQKPTAISAHNNEVCPFMINSY